MNQLSNHFEQVASHIDLILSKPPLTSNSLEIKLRAILQEERQMCREALAQLISGEPDWKQLREFITILYHDDEIANSTLSAWKRACQWMNLGDPHQIERLVAEMRQRLDQAVPTIRKVYGLDDARYILPNVFRAEAIQQEEA